MNECDGGSGMRRQMSWVSEMNNMLSEDVAELEARYWQDAVSSGSDSAADAGIEQPSLEHFDK